MDDKNIVILRVEYFEVIKFLQRRQLYEEQHKNRNSKLILWIN